MKPAGPDVAEGRSRAGRKWPWVLVALLVVAAWALYGWLGQRYSGRSDPSYELAISADGSRVAVRKWTAEQGVRLFEGPVGAPLAELQPPPGQVFAGAVGYAVDAQALLHATAPPGTRHPQVVWRQPLPIAAGPTRVFEHAMGVTYLRPMRNGGIVFFGQVREQPRLSGSPNPRSRGSWQVYRWMRWTPAAGVEVIDDKDRLMSPPPTLVRDESLLLVESTRDRDASGLEGFSLRVIPLSPTAADPGLQALVPARGLSEPVLLCDWKGTTCLRTTTYNKGYYAHRAELLLNGKACLLEGLPDRLENKHLSSDGSAAVLLVREEPYEAPYQALVVRFDRDRCGIAAKIPVQLP